MTSQRQQAADRVAQPPSAVSSMEVAKPATPSYRRNLPHINNRKTFFITFSTCKRWILPESVRGLVITHALHDHGTKINLRCIVVMPDHVHIILTPLCDPDENTFGLAEIMSGIKSCSARAINKKLGRRGSVWQDESFDHILRSNEKLVEKIEYIYNNPVRKGLAKRPDDYLWLWKEPAEQ
jgi:REP element-mobilizing transposase RayT